MAHMDSQRNPDDARTAAAALPDATARGDRPPDATKRVGTKWWKRHIAVEGGSAELAIQNIVVHLDVLLSDEQKAAINWHPEQSASLAVMRVIARDRDREPVSEDRPPAAGEGPETVGWDLASGKDRQVYRCLTCGFITESKAVILSHASFCPHGIRPVPPEQK